MPQPSLSVGLNTIWVVLTASMIFFMEGGFALLEAGFIRSKNHVSIIMKVFADLIFGVFAYFVVGFGLMFGKDTLGLFGRSGFALSGSLSHLPTTIPHSAFWLFQSAFTVAAVSIVSGAVAERMNFKAYLLFAIIMTSVIYPISGHWVWAADGWLGKLGMKDFAGSTVIHAMAGFSALVAAQMVGPRIGKFDKNGRSQPFAPSNIPLAAIGTFILWFGWFGFNSGSTLNAEANDISQIAMNTLLASIAGGGSALLYTLFRNDKADVSATMNGILSGLVAITAGCAYVSPFAALIIGACSGVLMIWATTWFDILKIDDPVGAIAVHGVNGLFGTVMVGFFSQQGGLFTTGNIHLLAVQCLGAVTVSVWGMATTWGSLKLIRLVSPLRVTKSQEELGLDLSHHGLTATHVDLGVKTNSIPEHPILKKSHHTSFIRETVED
ncbi:ammonium transporter [Alicyclobacillus dauci]|uniref:Ammonium transporter n=1 Tax=Alicyclobacillus dauci TaxID=1475485 RepID=A0ABY6YXX2_9BACL|nr:ammonium transporter [Alicyclobacillus dauci]WAH35272.1 ammonium transporter [Alicyclobacillus dauci]